MRLVKMLFKKAAYSILKFMKKVNFFAKMFLT